LKHNAGGGNVYVTLTGRWQLHNLHCQTAVWSRSIWPTALSWRSYFWSL